MNGFIGWCRTFFAGIGCASHPAGLDVAAVSDRGLSRPDNQDCYIARPKSWFLAVADGMGGGQGGALASAWICEEFAKALDVSPAVPFRQRVTQTDAALQEANGRIREYAADNGFKSMGSTAVVMMADPDNPSRAVVAHVGDSRLYRWRRGKGALLTRDHTVGNELGRAFSNASRATALQSRRNPLTHVLTRAVGVGFKVRAEWRKIDLLPGDRYLLCTDGVHDVLSDEQITALMGRAKTPALAVDAVSDKVVASGAPDNYTMVCAFATKA